jgi:hypothetical protein
MSDEFSFNRYSPDWDGKPVIQYYQGSNFVYVPIPKCASSTMMFRLGIKKYPLETKENISKIQKEKFTIIRNPYSRLLSAWNGKLLKKLGSSITNIDGFYYGMPFKDFIYKLNDLPPNLMEQHFAPYYTILNGLDIKYYGKVETFEQDYLMLKSKYDIPDSNKFHAITGVGKKYEDYYDSEMYKIVNKIYENDFILFNYKMIEK